MSVLSLALAASVVFPSFASAEYNNFSPVTVIGEKYTWRSVEKWPGGSVASGNYVITYRDGNSGNVNVNSV